MADSTFPVDPEIAFSFKVDLKLIAGQSEPVNATSSEAPAVAVHPHNSQLADWLTNYPADVFGDRLYQSIEVMERYSIELTIHVLRQLDAINQLADWKSARELCRALSFQPRFCSALEWLLERLIETGCIEARTTGSARVFRLRHMPWESEMGRVRALGMEIHPGNAATFDLLDHAAGLYPAVARGELNGDQSLFDPKGIGLWLSYFHNDNPTYAVNNWIGAILASDRVSSQPRLRILEIGAGAGSGTETLLRWFEQRDLLPRIERYLVTEPNAFFRRRAQKTLPNRYSNVTFEWGALDLNQPWREQVSAPAQFDLIYAVNVLHISKDLLFSLTQAASLLSENGWLVIGECVRPYPDQPIYPELMFQNLASFADVRTDPEIRPRAGFLTPEQWRRAFDRAGLVRTGIAPDMEGIRSVYNHFFAGAICGQKGL
jgi:SAM-dependent methyltransferase